MSVEAIVSGQANVALFWEGDALYSLHPGGEPVRRREREVGFLLGDAKDLLHFQGIDRPRVAFELDLEVRRADALHLALMLLDAELEAETREEAAIELEELFADAKVSEFVENVLYSRPLPREADISGAIEAAGTNSRVATYISDIVRHQSQISEAWIAWQGIPDKTFTRTEDRQQALSAAVRSGGFRRLTALLFHGESMDLLLGEALVNGEVAAVPRHREIWEQWVKPLRDESRYTEPKFEALEVAESALEKLEPPRKSFAKPLGAAIVNPETLFSEHAEIWNRVISRGDLNFNAIAARLRHDQEVALRNVAANLKKYQAAQLAKAAQLALDEVKTVRRILDPSSLFPQESRQDNLRIFGMWQASFAVDDYWLRDLEQALRPDLGMLLALNGQFELAHREFLGVLRHSWSPVNESYLRTALAAVEIQQRQFAQAIKTLSAEVVPDKLVVADVLRLHAVGALGRREEAQVIAERLPADSAKVLEIGVELRRRYIEGAPLNLSDADLGQRELELVVAA